jgi:hypothetical protein
VHKGTFCTETHKGDLSCTLGKVLSTPRQPLKAWLRTMMKSKPVRLAMAFCEYPALE